MNIYTGIVNGGNQMPKNAKCHHGQHHEKCSSNVKCLIQVLEALVGDSDCQSNHHEVEGCITLNQGHHEITVTTDECPERVFLSVLPISTPVCVGDIDMVGYSLTPEGFILYADIKSAVAEVCYIVQG
jgi:hypothetical protein